MLLTRICLSNFVQKYLANLKNIVPSLLLLHEIIDLLGRLRQFFRSTAWPH